MTSIFRRKAHHGCILTVPPICSGTSTFFPLTPALSLRERGGVRGKCTFDVPGPRVFVRGGADEMRPRQRIGLPKQRKNESCPAFEREVGEAWRVEAWSVEAWSVEAWSVEA